jgi:hypothetical protein
MKWSDRRHARRPEEVVKKKDTNPIKKNLNCSKYDLIKNTCSAYKQLDPELNERKLHSLCGKMIAGFFKSAS